MEASLSCQILSKKFLICVLKMNCFSFRTVSPHQWMQWWPSASSLLCPSSQPALSSTSFRNVSPRPNICSLLVESVLWSTGSPTFSGTWWDSSALCVNKDSSVKCQSLVIAKCFWPAAWLLISHSFVCARWTTPPAQWWLWPFSWLLIRSATHHPQICQRWSLCFFSMGQSAAYVDFHWLEKISSSTTVIFLSLFTMQVVSDAHDVPHVLHVQCPQHGVRVPLLHQPFHWYQQ